VATVVQQPVCGCARPHHALGFCAACYKRLLWRPRGGPAVRRSDQASRWAKGRYFGVHSRPRRHARCASCHRFKSRPSSICAYCGDDPVGNCGLDPSPHDRYEYDRAHGWSDPPF
jgi:hypothetical protein